MPKRIIPAVLLSLLLPAASYGQDDSAELILEDIGIEYCRWVSILAKDIMTARQKDKPMSETLPFALDRVTDFSADIMPEFEEFLGQLDEQSRAEFLAQLEQTEKNLRSGVKLLVAGAYDIPAYSVEGNRSRVISHFENLAFSACFEGVERVDLEE